VADEEVGVLIATFCAALNKPVSAGEGSNTGGVTTDSGTFSSIVLEARPHAFVE
jgi:hypothetical protein